MTLCGDFYGLFASGTPSSPMMMLLDRQHWINDMEHMKKIAQFHIRNADVNGSNYFAAILFVENDGSMFVFKREEL